MSFPASLLSLLELAVNSENAARQIAEMLEPDELTSKDPVTQALNMLINASLNNEFEQGLKDIAENLTQTPVPEISRILVEHAECPDVTKAVNDCVADFRRLKSKDRKKELMDQLRRAVDSGEKMAILKEITALK